MSSATAQLNSVLTWVSTRFKSIIFSRRSKAKISGTRLPLQVRVGLANATEPYPRLLIGEPTMFRGAAVAIIVGLVTSGALAAQQAATGNDGEEWYKIATGIIAIPAALLGVLISWNMVRRTRLETRKLQLEIDDRERTLVETSKGESDVPLVLAPLSESQKAVLIIIRFVLLELTLRIWDFVPSAFLKLFTISGLGLYVTFVGGGQNLTEGMAIFPIFAALLNVVEFLFSIVYWIFVFAARPKPARRHEP
jgi:hypothetical protein